ncbi:hypothetical protein [Lutibaculum baratangense]|uniref:Ribosomal protein S4 n=1 Tax=Lutibaculum baratangense AMV1 TaxID=631454 RepID=V4RKM8_9HYPH|nr:hypothetical protein [Lutibaculum baratangense]ESR23815.1 Ribosomal protein S4 [Lutibaculum baratangense AMV1]
MAFVYCVRCNFNDPGREADWNDWYSGPKLAQMLRKPLFLSGQRFKATGLNTARQYLALWTVDSPKAFETEEYTSDWGFFEWAPYITDWNRDLYGPPAGDPSTMFAAGEGDALYLISFEDLSSEEAEAVLARVEGDRPGMTWLRAVGLLDQHSPILGLRLLKADDPRPQMLGEPKIQETIFESISHCARPDDAEAQ